MRELASAFSNVLVHHNLGNFVEPTDLNCMSALQAAIDVVGVTDVIVCGHHDCLAVKAALSDEPLGRIDNWISPIIELYEEWATDLDIGVDTTAFVDKLCEINVCQQISNLCRSDVVQSAWTHNRPVTVHGWIHDRRGKYGDLGVRVSGAYELRLAEAAMALTSDPTRGAAPTATVVARRPSAPTLDGTR